MRRARRYRIWDAGEKCWLWDSRHAVNLLGEVVIFGSILEGVYGDSVPLSRLGDLVVEDFVGMVDKNGTEIYEGDVLMTPSGQRVTVVWSFAYFTFVLLELSETTISSNAVLIRNSVVIGNVHETEIP